MGAQTTEISRGSEWRRWDPHLHAPGTLLNDQFSGNWETYIQRIETATPIVEALGVTDYFSIGTYQKVREQRLKGCLQQVKLVFPNVEVRLDIKTAKQRPINIHLLFSPEDTDHEKQIERVLSQLTFSFGDRTYRCTFSDLADLGRAFSKKPLADLSAVSIGANQFKTTLSDLRRLFKNELWMRKNCLVAAAGNLGDGTSGLQEDDSFEATRREIERFAHIIFSATPAQRDFWIGKKTGFPVRHIEERYGALKPCLHGSDAHRDEAVAVPDLDRFCWLKGDPIFETLRQAVLEPEDRVWIGPSQPSDVASLAITTATVSGAPWLDTCSVPLNSGLIAIIGARGSGKTALADIIAAGAHALQPSQGDSSFIRRATKPVNHLATAAVQLTWSDGTTPVSVPLSAPQRESDAVPTAAYLSQHFVEQLCSAAGLATELRAEMERVVFDATDPTARLGTTSFDEFLEVLLEPTRVLRAELQSTIASISARVVHEEGLKESLKGLSKERETLTGHLGQNKRALTALVPKGNQGRAEQLERVELACSQLEAEIDKLARRKKALLDLASAANHVTTYAEPTRFSEMKRRFVEAQLDDGQWQEFMMRFVGDPPSVVAEASKVIAGQIDRLTKARQSPPVDLKGPIGVDWPLESLRAKRELLKQEAGIDALKQRRYNELQKAMGRQEATLRRLTAEIANAEGAEVRRKELIGTRRAAYADIFKTLTDEEEVLADVYAPLKGELSSASGTLGKLRFVVQRRVDVEGWVRRGEELIDLRRATRLRGHGALMAEAERHLLSAWGIGSAEDVASAMDAFRAEYQADWLQAMPASVTPDSRRSWVQDVASWLYDTSHIAVEYGMTYDGVPIERLSPGTRGIVLMLLYLAMDRNDQRPLIIDQPEENLDPNSVFHELVPHFRDARKRRQVIVVTHNANLVVNTDADQVIVAESVRDSAESLPTISYRSGSLENPDIRHLVCEILEGGERAFLERERRYRLRWDDVIADSALPG